MTASLQLCLCLPVGQQEVWGTKVAGENRCLGQRIPKRPALLPGWWTEADGRRSDRRRGLGLIRSKLRARGTGARVSSWNPSRQGLLDERHVGPAAPFDLGRFEASFIESVHRAGPGGSEDYRLSPGRQVGGWTRLSPSSDSGRRPSGSGDAAQDQAIWGHIKALSFTWRCVLWASPDLTVPGLLICQMGRMRTESLSPARREGRHRMRRGGGRPRTGSMSASRPAPDLPMAARFVLREPISRLEMCVRAAPDSKQGPGETDPFCSDAHFSHLPP